MERIEKTVFLSYRRTNIPWALAIFQDLIQHGYDVFFDYNGIGSGDFERIILENIAARAHFLVLLTPSALRRCGDAADWLRREIEAAMDARRNMVPLMLDGFSFTTPIISKQLTGKLSALKDYNALGIPPEYFSEAMARLRDKFLNVPLDAVLHPASVPAQRAATEQNAVAEMAPAVLKEELTEQQSFERTLSVMDAFAERYFPVDGRTFLSRSGTWACELERAVDVSGVDRRVFFLRFALTRPDPRWKGPPANERKLELRTSLASFHFTPGYADWLRLVIDGFLDSDKIEHMQEAYEVERQNA